jgi:GNAT superfamily N-acetyltransferase
LDPPGRTADYLVEPLAPHHDRRVFSSGVPSLDDYLNKRAGQDAKRRLAAPYVLVSAEQPEVVVGFYTLSQLSVLLDELPPAVASKLPSYAKVPVTLLGRLAVDERHRGQGLGERLLVDALHRAWRVSQEIASFAVFVEAKDATAAAFYLRFGFLPLTDQPLRLLLPMTTLQQLFGPGR